MLPITLLYLEVLRIPEHIRSFFLFFLVSPNIRLFGKYLEVLTTKYVLLRL